MNYNRCIYQVEDSHDDAISRLALIKIPASRSFLLVTSSWDSSIKIWLTSPISKPRSHKQRSSSLSSSMFDQNFKLQFLNELSHDSAVLDFCLTRTHLASICEDGDVLLWRLNSTRKQNLLITTYISSLNLPFILIFKQKHILKKAASLTRRTKKTKNMSEKHSLNYSADSLVFQPSQASRPHLASSTRSSTLTRWAK